ncbi:MAG TPA: DEAD/DEAH box helicase, partial [Candidatus Thermoplasmatota archaeon]|nr:DEAD/DEAH box helicase [Candidatus Thermoplasmatota archaeon]
MKLEDLDLPARAVEALRRQGYGDLWPSQEQAAPIAVSGENLVLAIPTASGKSLVSYLAILKKVLSGGKGLYIVPLRALAAEKYEDLLALGKDLGFRVAISTGDLDAEEPGLAQFDVIVATSEKADALMRHRAHWLTSLDVIVSDEVHLLNDADRGPTLEVLLSRFKQLNPKAQIIALSATIANSEQLAKWLRAHHVKTQWRPVTLREGILYGKGIKYLDNQVEQVRSTLKDEALALAEDAVATGGQCLVFVNTRKSTEAVADKLREAVYPHLTPEARQELVGLAARIRGREGGDQTSVEKKLARCLEHGVAFHHAGLTGDQRTAVERAFKKGLLRAITATPTLAAGVNLPARRVIIRDLWRYDANEGNAPIPVLDYKQMAGRAGRPRFDQVGEAITIAKSIEARQEILLNYLLADPERVISKLSTEPALRMHLLASIASGFVKDEASLKAFIENTFYAEQESLWRIMDRITTVVDFLLENDFITQTGAAFEATKFGKRVSELYIDPLSAVTIREALGNYSGKRITPLSFLHTICATPDMRVLFTRQNDVWLEGEVVEHQKEFLLPLPDGSDYEWFLAQVKTAYLLQDWIEEATDEDMMKKYQVYPGDVFQKVETATWLLYATREIARLFRPEATKEIARVEARVINGAKEELLPLLALKGIGRYRARQLFRAGFTDTAALKAATARALADVPGIGPVLANSIKKQLGQEEEATAQATPEPAPAA